MLLKGKKGLITGVANSQSIAWSVAKMASEYGAECIFSYQGEVLKKRVGPLAEEIGCKALYECDLSDEGAVFDMFDKIKKDVGDLDFVLHSVGFANREDLKGRYLDTSPAGFNTSLSVSSYSLNSLVKGFEKVVSNNGGSVVAMTYYGSVKVVPSYNVMGVAKAALEAGVRYIASEVGQKGIRVNAISAGPIKTLAASAISGFRSMLSHVSESSPLRRNVTGEDIAGSAVYLFSDLSRGVTGEIHYVDCGYNIMGVPIKI
ncbi:enoyl-ACP reductase FabI [Candidatus Sneabacter namystus]|uniref:enoyl-ACP reductase FabI n=1 Tax=Candidatus Sneabacter namystus TaxID=2601646 RepID=UPI00155A50FB|nr:enoyl-ACP reductase [Candidatus Sneabacter namystus]